MKKTQSILLLVFATLIVGVFYLYGYNSFHNVHIAPLLFDGRVAVVPLEKVSNDDVTYVKTQIEKFYGFQVDVLDRRRMPESAYYQPRSRYKARLVLDYLTMNKSSKYDKVIALTNSDISAKVKDHDDWGVIGLAYLGKEACVVSTYRLGKRIVSNERFRARLAKASLHEIGHTLGLPHCVKSKECFMQDARGKVRTIDNAKFRLCVNCKKQVSPFMS